jgi:peptidoglycan/xylan/chitin deacetylase (PgdA/CDA1 family)
VGPGRLAEQLEALADAGFSLLGLTEALARRRDDATAPVVALTFDDGFRDFRTAALPALAAVNARATLYVAVGHVGRPAQWLGRHAADFAPLLDWDELREVRAAGVELGSHGLVHTPLDVLPPKVVRVQVRAARDRLVQQTGAPVASFAYPHGYHTRRVRAVVSEFGHETACEVGHRLYRGEDDRHAIPRLQVTGEHTGADVVTMVSTGGSSWGPRLRRLAQPGWRLVRRAANDVLHVRLT